jgi:lactoylglutathione lyase
MKTLITHFAVYTHNIEKMKEYYIKYFNGVSNEKYSNTKGFSSYFITFSSGARLEIMAHTELEQIQPLDKVTGWNHIAFSVGSKEAVAELTNLIEDGGYKIFSYPRETGDGYFESCVSDPDGNRVEITI